MKKIIIIGSCVDCPHFIDAFKNSRFKESCILKHKNVYYDKNTHTYPIPKWCPLDDYEDNYNLMQNEITNITR